MIRRVALAVGGGSTKKNNITIRALITRKYPDNNSTAQLKKKLKILVI